MASSKKYLHYIILLLIPAACLIYAITYRLQHMLPLDILWANMQHYNEKQDYISMARVYAPLVKKYPDNAELTYTLAWAYYKINKTKEAATLMRHYEDINPYYPLWRRYYVRKVIGAGTTYE